MIDTWKSEENLSQIKPVSKFPGATKDPQPTLKQEVESLTAENEALKEKMEQLEKTVKDLANSQVKENSEKLQQALSATSSLNQQINDLQKQTTNNTSEITKLQSNQPNPQPLERNNSNGDQGTSTGSTEDANAPAPKRSALKKKAIQDGN